MNLVKPSKEPQKKEPELKTFYPKEIRHEIAESLVKDLWGKVGRNWNPEKDDAARDLVCVLETKLCDEALAALAGSLKPVFLQAGADCLKHFDGKPVHEVITGITGSKAIEDFKKANFILATFARLEKMYKEAKETSGNEKIIWGRNPVKEALDYIERGVQDNSPMNWCWKMKDGTVLHGTPAFVDNLGKVHRDDGALAYEGRVTGIPREPTQADFYTTAAMRKIGTQTLKFVEAAAATAPDKIAAGEKQKQYEEVAGKIVTHVKFAVQGELHKGDNWKAFVSSFSQIPDNLLARIGSNENTDKLPKLFRRLYAAFINEGAGDTPLNVINLVLADTAIGVDQKFEASLLVLFKFFDRMMDTTDSHGRATTANNTALATELLGMVKGDDPANVTNAIGGSIALLEVRMKVRSALGRRLKANEQIQKIFMDDLSIRIYLPALKKLDADLIGQLATAKPNSVQDRYIRFHAQTLLRGGFEVPGDIIRGIAGEKAIPNELKILALAAVFKTTAKLKYPTPREVHGADDGYIHACKKAANERTSQIIEAIAKGPEAAQKALEAEVLAGAA